MGYLKWFDYVLMVHTFLGIGYSLKDFVYRPKTTSKIWRSKVKHQNSKTCGYFRWKSGNVHPSWKEPTMDSKQTQTV